MAGDLIAAHGPRMMRATGRYADAWFPGTTRASEYGEQLQIVRAAASDAGRDPMAISPALIRFIVTGRSRGEIDEVVESDIAKVFTLNSPAKDWARHGAQHPMGADFAGVQDLIPQTIDEQTALSFAAKVPRSLVEELFAVGTPDKVVDQDQGVPRQRFAVPGSGQRRCDPAESAEKRHRDCSLRQGCARAEEALRRA